MGASNFSSWPWPSRCACGDCCAAEGCCAAGSVWSCAIAGRPESTSAPLVTIAQDRRKSFAKAVITSPPYSAIRLNAAPLTVTPHCDRHLRNASDRSDRSRGVDKKTNVSRPLYGLPLNPDQLQPEYSLLTAELISDRGTPVAAIKIVGNYSAGDFHVISGDGGTVEITDPTVARLHSAAHALEILCAEVLQVEEIAEQLLCALSDGLGCYEQQPFKMTFAGSNPLCPATQCSLPYAISRFVRTADISAGSLMLTHQISGRQIPTFRAGPVALRRRSLFAIFQFPFRYARDRSDM